MNFHLKVHSIIGGAPGEPGSPGGAVPGGDLGFGGGGSGSGGGGGLLSMEQSKSMAKTLAFALPFLGPFMGQVIDAAEGDPNPATGMGVSGPNGVGGVGGGPGNPMTQVQQALMQRPGMPPAPQFQINPMQVQNDMRGGWGMPQPGGYQQPQMNPFSMYGNSQNPFVPQFGGYQMPPSMSQGQLGFDWGNYMNTFGGK